MRLVKQSNGVVHKKLAEMVDTPNPKVPKTLYNTGLPISVLNNLASLSSFYDYSFQAKYQAHSGAIKIEIRF